MFIFLRTKLNLQSLPLSSTAAGGGIRQELFPISFIINDIYIFQWRLLNQGTFHVLAFCRTCPANFCTVCLSTQVCKVHVVIRNECYTEWSRKERILLWVRGGEARTQWQNPGWRNEIASAGSPWALVPAGHGHTGTKLLWLFCWRIPRPTEILGNDIWSWCEGI